MPKKLKVVESEKSTGVVHANWKQKEFLEKNVQLIKRAEKMVTNRITLNQRLMYKKFKQKLYQAKLNHARLIGDKEAERELRSNTDRFSFNTNFGLDPEDEEVLQKIWSRSAPVPSNVRPQSSPQRLQGNMRLGTMGISAVSVGRPSPKPRPKTTLPDIARDADRKGQYIATGGRALDDQEHSGDDIDFSSDEEEDDRPTGHRPKTAHFAGNLPTRHRPGTRPTPRAQSSIPPPTPATTIFEEDKGPTLLDKHREKVQSANYEGRVKSLCTSMKPFVISKDYLIPDYYTVRLNKEVKDIGGRKKFVDDIPGTPLSDIKRSMGNVEVKSLTLKRINYDFKSPGEVHKTLECLTL